MILKGFDICFFCGIIFFMTDKPKLTPKQEMFCREYLIDLNGTQAAIRAGYSAKTAGQIAEQNLKKLEIQSYLEELKGERQESTKITAEWVLKEAQECYNALKAEKAHKDALKALDLIGRHTGVKAFDKNANEKDTTLEVKISFEQIKEKKKSKKITAETVNFTISQ